MDLKLYLLQRATALIMAPLVIGHVVIMFYATSQGLTAGDILGRTAGSVGWATFYGVFVIAVAIHGAIGLRNIVREWFGATDAIAAGLMWGTGAMLAILGLRGVIAVTFPGMLS